MVLWKGIGIMKNGILAIIGLCVWGGLLMLQGTPKVSEEIAADVVQTLHPQAEVGERDGHDRRQRQSL